MLVGVAVWVTEGVLVAVGVAVGVGVTVGVLVGVAVAVGVAVGEGVLVTVGVLVGVGVTVGVKVGVNEGVFVAVLVAVGVAVGVGVGLGVGVAAATAGIERPAEAKKLDDVRAHCIVTDAAPAAVLPPPITSWVGGPTEVARFQRCVLDAVIEVASARTATAFSTIEPAALGTATEAVVEVWPPELVTGTRVATGSVKPVKDAEPPVNFSAAANVTATALVPTSGFAIPHISTRTWFCGAVIPPRKVSA